MQASQTQLEEVMAASKAEIKSLKAKIREINSDWSEDATEWQVCLCVPASILAHNKHHSHDFANYFCFC